MKRVALLASVPFAALVLLAGCDDNATSATASGSGTPATSAAGSASAHAGTAGGEPPPAAGTPTRKAKPKRTTEGGSDPGDAGPGDPGDGDFLFGSDGSETASFQNMVKPCLDSPLAPVIQK